MITGGLVIGILVLLLGLAHMLSHGVGLDDDLHIAQILRALSVLFAIAVAALWRWERNLDKGREV